MNMLYHVSNKPRNANNNTAISNYPCKVLIITLRSGVPKSRRYGVAFPEKDTFIQDDIVDDMGRLRPKEVPFSCRR